MATPLTRGSLMVSFTRVRMAWVILLFLGEVYRTCWKGVRKLARRSKPLSWMVAIPNSASMGVGITRGPGSVKAWPWPNESNRQAMILAFSMPTTGGAMLLSSSLSGWGKKMVS